MAKKLDVELKVDSSKARNQIQEGLDGVAAEVGAGAAGAPTSAVASGLDKAAKAAKGFADDTERMNRQMTMLVRSFAGIAGGMAASFAASQMHEGRARDAVEYGANALTGGGMGAALGSRLGPWGTAAGAILGAATGVGKTWMEKDSQRDRAAADFDEHERRYADNREFADFMKGLSDIGDKSKSVAQKLEEAKDTLYYYKTISEPHLIQEVKDLNRQGMFEDASRQLRSLDTNRQRQTQLQSFIDSTERALQNVPGMKESFSALDALSRIGGNTGGGDTMQREQLDVQKDTLKTLNRMENKMANGGATWQ